MSSNAINTFIYLDLESTGLKRARIMELSLVAVEPRHISEKPRVLNKLVLCFNPDGARFDEWAQANTGLNPDNLSRQWWFDWSTVKLLERFLGVLPGPGCLVAHNGYKVYFKCYSGHCLRSRPIFLTHPTFRYKFDFPLLMKEIGTVWRKPEQFWPLYCVDTLPACEVFLPGLESYRLTCKCLRAHDWE